MNSTTEPRVSVPLVRDTVSREEIDALSDWLKTYPRLTKGELTIAFEEAWCKWQGRKHSIFVNSGSSANLAAFYGLLISSRLRNNKVVVPAVSWATTVAPAIQLGFEPIACECDRETLGVDPVHLEALFEEHRPASLIIVHVLGFPNKMDEIMHLCAKYDVFLIEDTCESLGSAYKEKKTGNFGLISTFSLYFGHHLSTIEGGMICTDDDEIADLLRSIRSHGWDRDLPDERKHELRSKYDVDSFRALYNFYYPGFNIRATDLQAFIGLGQLQKADHVTAARNTNLQIYSDLIRNDHWKIQELDGTFVSNFCYPIITPKLRHLVRALHENGVETRPLVCGSITRHPFWFERYGHQSLPFADEVHDFGLYLPNNHELTESEIEFVCSVVNKAIYD